MNLPGMPERPTQKARPTCLRPPASTPFCAVAYASEIRHEFLGSSSGGKNSGNPVQPDREGSYRARAWERNLETPARIHVKRWLVNALVGLGVAACARKPQPSKLVEEVATKPKQTAAAPTPEISAAPASEAAMPTGVIAKALFGNVDGNDVTLHTLTNQNGLVMKVTTYGAIITELHVPDKEGRSADIVLGFENLDGYLKGSPYFGATVGRVGNRIRDARFKLDGKEYKLADNDKPHHLHGGNKGWDKVVWDAETSETAEGPSIKFTYVSKDGEEGYPGTVTAHAVYTLTNRNELKVEMKASTDKKTLINMVHHSYWNLGGHGSGPITEHELTLNADKYTPGDPIVPTGASKPVNGTAFDFTKPKPIGKDLRGDRRRSGRLRSQLRRQRQAERDTHGGQAQGPEVRPGHDSRGRSARAFSSTRATSSTAKQRAKASRTRNTLGSASKPRSFRTRSTSPPGRRK